LKPKDFSWQTYQTKATFYKNFGRFVEEAFGEGLTLVREKKRMIAQVMIYPDVLITKTPYDPDFVSNLKRFIPPKQRKWNPIER